MDLLVKSLEPYPSIALAEQETLAGPEALPLEALEHGAHYAGKLGVAAVVARWHAKKRRFVFVEFSLGRNRVRSVAHISASGTEQRFIPLSRTEPRDSNRLSDYAFETGS